MNKDTEELYVSKEKRPGLFSPDGMGTEFFRQTGGIIVLTLMWMIGCIPILTIGTSTAALYYATVKAVRRSHGQPWREFMRAYQRNLKSGISITCILLLCGGIIGYEIWLVNTNALDLGDLWMVASWTILGFLGFLSLFIFPVMSRFDVPFSKLWTLSFLIAMRSWYMGVLLAMLLAAMILMQLYILPIPLILITPGLTVYIGSFLMEKAMKKFMPPTEEEWYS